MNEEKLENVKKAVHELVEQLEEAANVARRNYDDAKACLDEVSAKRYENLSMSICFDLLKASELDSSL